MVFFILFGNTISVPANKQGRFAKGNLSMENMEIVTLLLNQVIEAKGVTINADKKNMNEI